MDVFRRLGELLEARWRQHDYDERVFPDLAAALLEEADELEKIGALDILRWIGSQPALPAQQDAPSRFGDLAITFYDTPRFFVSALFWLDGTTAIHQHSFCGAFRVLAGGSLHTRYRFRVERAVNSRFRLGELDRGQVELLVPGSVRPIASGDRFIHSLFHLERPSVTVVIRT
jgi:predicted metal-dependent enzyme (double-stranded beta helix superfamily)